MCLRAEKNLPRVNSLADLAWLRWTTLGPATMSAFEPKHVRYRIRPTFRNIAPLVIAEGNCGGTRCKENPADWRRRILLECRATTSCTYRTAHVHHPSDKTQRQAGPGQSQRRSRENAARSDGTQASRQPRCCLAVSRAEQEIGFRAETKFRDGLQQTINWYRDRYARLYVGIRGGRGMGFAESIADAANAEQKAQL